MDIQERIAIATESIAKNLSTLAEDTKATRKLQEQNRKLFLELEKKISDLAADPFGFMQKES
ncbi:hypothetical protein ASB83_15095 [Listeria monocytogenes]|nr:hypothetical protein [Listeria monocytogenes]